MKKITKKPWGNFEVLKKERKITIKILTVKKGARLSLQSHKMRDEIWLLLDGDLYCEIEGLEVKMKKGIAYIIPRSWKHRLRAGREKGRVLEVSFGKFSERDIIRYQDDYGRT